MPQLSLVPPSPFPSSPTPSPLHPPSTLSPIPIYGSPASPTSAAAPFRNHAAARHHPRRSSTPSHLHPAHTPPLPPPPFRTPNPHRLPTRPLLRLTHRSSIAPLPSRCYKQRDASTPCHLPVHLKQHQEPRSESQLEATPEICSCSVSKNNGKQKRKG